MRQMSKTTLGNDVVHALQREIDDHGYSLLRGRSRPSCSPSTPASSPRNTNGRQSSRAAEWSRAISTASRAGAPFCLG
jgi:hypothetical protein